MEDRRHGELGRSVDINDPTFETLGRQPDPKEREKQENRLAVKIAYKPVIDWATQNLKRGRSTIIICPKSLNFDLSTLITEELSDFEFMRLGNQPHRTPVAGDDQQEAPRHQLAVNALLEDLSRKLRLAIGEERPILILNHLDLMTASVDGNLREQANDLIYWLSEFRSIPLLAFSDPMFPLPQVIQDLFAVKKQVLGIDREVLFRLLTPKEARKVSVGRFTIADQLRLYQYVSGVDVIKLRRILRQIAESDEFSDLSTIDGAEPVYRRIRELTTLSDLRVPEVDRTAIGGYDAVKSELEKRVLFPFVKRNSVSTQEQLAQADILVPKGVILYGPPGTGKTELSKWLATESRATLIEIHGPELKQMYFGESERLIRRIFSQARMAAPSIILIDELDSMATARHSSSSDAQASMVAQFLTEMDGFSRDEAVLVIGTTNRLHAVDTAFLRPSRFSVILEIGYPNADDRAAIVRLYNQKWSLGLTEDSLQMLVEQTSGFIDPMAEDQKLHYRDAVITHQYGEDFVRTAGEGFIQKLNAELGIEGGIRWSGDHLREICRELLLTVSWSQRDEATTDYDVNDRSMILSAAETVRRAYMASQTDRESAFEGDRPLVTFQTTYPKERKRRW